jgi:uncharacterized protein (TIGR02231 family)
MDLDLATTISAVTVYPDRAQITRTGATRLDAPGEHTLRIGGLPLALLPDSVRASGKGPSGMRILAVEQSHQANPSAPEETIKALQGEIERLERELALLDERLRSVQERQGWLSTLGDQAARSLAWGIARGSTKPEDASGLFTYADEQSQYLASARQEIQTIRDETQRALDARIRELNRLGGADRPDRVVAAVRIETTAAGEVQIELSYLLYGASWRPRYDARVDAAVGRVKLTQQALVSQRTGEDWANVALALSTARPSAATRLPDEPDPWYLDLYKPAPPVPVAGSAQRAAFKSRASLSSGFAAEAAVPMAAQAAMDRLEEAPVAAEFAMAEIERAGSAQVFRVPGGVGVPPDGEARLFGVGEYDAPVKLDYVAQPVYSPGAHLRATATNTAGRVLLPGELHVFQAGAGGDEYVGQTRLELTAENAELPLYLGVDDNLTAKRELIERDTDKGSLLQRGVRKTTFGYRVTLANRTGAAQHVTLQDVLPVPRNERIKLNTLEMRPQPSARTKLEQLTWELDLAPNEEKKVEWRFVVESPTDADVTNLP